MKPKKTIPKKRAIPTPPARSTYPPGSDAALEELLSIEDVKQRIRRIAEDVQSGANHFSSIDPFDLLEALGFDRPPDIGWDGWEKLTAAEILPIEEVAELNSPPSCLIEAIEGDIPANRYNKLLQKAEQLEEDGDLDLSFLTKKERTLIEIAFAKLNLENYINCGVNGIGRLTIENSNLPLLFEGEIEDDGDCIRLRGPYDFPAGQFDDLSNCVIEAY